MNNNRGVSISYMIKRGFFLAVPLGFGTLFAPAAFAQTATGTLTVNASITASCSVGDATLAFSAYAPTSGDAVTQFTTIPVTCTAGTAYQLGLDTGGNAGEATTLGLTTRAMVGHIGGDYLSYELYQDNEYATVWGNATGTEPASANGTGSAVALTVYGKIPAGQTTAVPDTYSDSVTETVTY